MLWFIAYNITNIVKTLVICVLVVIVSVIAFKLMWMDNPLFKIPSFDYNRDGIFVVSGSFYRRIKFVVSHFYNYSYWLNNIGFDSNVTRLLLSAVHEADNYFSDVLSFSVHSSLYYLFSYKEDIERGVSLTAT